jgi:hypothetical protein
MILLCVFAPYFINSHNPSNPHPWFATALSMIATQVAM